jgi:hypothetical protein
MPQHVLYAYVHGSDLHDVAANIERRIQEFIEATTWHHDPPWLVNQRRDDDPSLGPGDLPDWDLGLNLNLPDPTAAPAGWFDDVQRIARFLGQLHDETGREFIIGIGDTTRPWFSEDLLLVDRNDPDLADLRTILGGGESAC